MFKSFSSYVQALAINRLSSVALGNKTLKCVMRVSYKAELWLWWLQTRLNTPNVSLESLPPLIMIISLSVPSSKC